MTNVLIVGNGGREAAIAHFLSKNSSCKIHVTPQLSGLNNITTCSVAYENFEDLISYIDTQNIKLVIIGPELPLMMGLSDHLRANNILVFGPSKKGAELEYSKLFCKEFLKNADIPTAPFHEITSVESLLESKNNFSPPWILKVDGLAAGKGVFICDSESELKQAGDQIFNKKIFGTQRAFLEGFIKGVELSYMILTNGEKAITLPIAQDHKRVLDGDLGPNTGGMGAVAPLKITAQLEQKIQDTIIKPFLDRLQSQNIMYRGVVYFGLMIDSKSTPYVLEINARFGDPEAQVILPLIRSNPLDFFLKTAQGDLPNVEFSPNCSVCIVLASPGYPDSPETGHIIEGHFSEAQEKSDTYFLPAGIAKNSDDKFQTKGGRVLNIISTHISANEARKSAYQLAKSFFWKGIHYRKDIGQKVLNGDEFIFNTQNSHTVK